MALEQELLRAVAAAAAAAVAQAQAQAQVPVPVLVEDGGQLPSRINFIWASQFICAMDINPFTCGQ